MSAGRYRYFGGEMFTLAGTFDPFDQRDERVRLVTWLRNNGYHFRRISVASGIAVYTDAPMEILSAREPVGDGADS